MVRPVFVIAVSMLAGLSVEYTTICPEHVASACDCYSENIRTTEVVQRHHVDCSSRGLYQIPVLNFPKWARIYKLSLANNTLITISSNVFPHQLHVEIINISTNPLGNSLTEDFFAKSTHHLKTLIAQDIGLNLRRSISFVRGLHSLEELDLSRNLEYAVNKLPELFHDNELHSLKKLSLSLCRISRITENAFHGLNNLRDLDLSLNFLSRVPRAVRSLSLLKKLNLRENDITVIHRGDFNDLRCLEELDLSINLLGQMEAFSDGAFAGLGRSLHSLKLHDCHMALIPTVALSELNQLRNLDLSNNKISFMSNRSFIGHFQLERFDISSNPWLIQYDMFARFENSLKELKMRNVGLTKVPTNSLSILRKLRHLDLSDNGIRKIENISLSTITARKLYLNGNKISYVSPYAFSHHSLPVALDLSDNILQSLDFVFKSTMCTFYRLNVSDNGFACNCIIETLINSKRVKYLTGNCAKSDGKQYSFGHVTSELERKCGKSRATFCFWWVPKTSGAESVVSAWFSIQHVLFVYLFLLSID